MADIECLLSFPFLQITGDLVFLFVKGSSKCVLNRVLLIYQKPIFCSGVMNTETETSDNRKQIPV